MNLTYSHSSILYAIPSTLSVPESVYATDHGSSAKLSEGVLTFTTEPVADRVITTQVIPLVNTSQTPETRDAGPFSFIVSIGKTTWLEDKTPPASMPFEVVTSYVALQPEPVTTIPSSPPS